MNTKLYLFSKLLHRIFMFSTTFLVIVMAITGGILKYPIIRLSFARSLHNNLSPFLTVSLFIMMITGIIMYLYPLMKRKK